MMAEELCEFCDNVGVINNATIHLCKDHMSTVAKARAEWTQSLKDDKPTLEFRIRRLEAVVEYQGEVILGLQEKLDLIEPPDLKPEERESLDDKYEIKWLINDNYQVEQNGISVYKGDENDCNEWLKAQLGYGEGMGS